MPSLYAYWSVADAVSSELSAQIGASLAPMRKTAKALGEIFGVRV